MVATLEELERRVIALEKAQNENTITLKWVAGTLAQVKSLGDDHTERLQRIEQTVNVHGERLQALEQTVNDQTGRLDRIEHDVKGLRRDMPGIVADALRDARATD